MQDNTDTFVVEEGVWLVQRLTMERERETAEGPRWRGAQGGGGTRSTQRAEVHLSCRDRSCCRWWLVVARQPRIPTDVTCEFLKCFFALDWLHDVVEQMLVGSFPSWLDWPGCANK